MQHLPGRWSWCLVGTGAVLLLVPWLVSAQAPLPRPLEEQMELLRVLHAQSQQDLERCQQQRAEMWIQATKINGSYQQLLQAHEALKAKVPPEPPQPSPPTN